ncbi:hypothetical protein N9Y92_04625 [Chlamydiales bacterium]|nr:hypothetical protein [Chlamydiales bacterium]
MTTYRGGVNERVDEFGGAEVEDVLRLIEKGEFLKNQFNIECQKPVLQVVWV